MTDTSELVKADFPTGLRQAAAREIKSLGVRFILLNEGDMVFTDFKQYPTYWNVTELAATNGTHFYRLN